MATASGDRIGHGHLRANIYWINVAERFAQAALVADMQTTSTELSLQMKIKTVSHRHLLSARQGLHRRINAGATRLPGISDMRAMRLLAPIKAAHMHLTELLRHPSDDDAIIVNDNSCNRVAALVGSRFSIGLLISQKHLMATSLAQIGQSLRRLLVNFKPMGVAQVAGTESAGVSSGGGGAQIKPSSSSWFATTQSGKYMICIRSLISGWRSRSALMASSRSLKLPPITTTACLSSTL